MVSMMRRFGLVRGVASLLVVAVTALGCANGAPDPIVCAAIGAVAGAGGGGAAGTHAHGSHDDEYVYGGAVLGGVLLGTAGYFICKALQAEEEEAPPPAPAPAPRAEPGPAPMAEKIVLRGVNFDFDKSNIRPDAAVILDEAVRILSGSSSPVSIEGHTDWIGTDAYNQGLSERRANAVQAYLIEHGVDASRLSTSGYGESRPIASNDTREGRALNRRVELHVQE
jgi:outer membrane protein OmpA-like peptidoglycan-associated protein